MSDSFVVDDGLYYRLCAAEHAVKAAKLAVQLAAMELASAEAELTAVHDTLAMAVTENGKYKVVDDFVLSATERTVRRSLAE